MVRFSKLKLDEHGIAVETDIREIAQSDIMKCPHAIFVGEHYRADGSCRCNDPEHVEMAEWGYVWRDGQWHSDEEGT
jgi:hypothetical protein